MVTAVSDYLQVGIYPATDWLVSVYDHKHSIRTGGGAVATNAEMNELIAHIRRTGYKVTKSGKHNKVLKPNGAVLIDAEEGGPVILSSSPGDSRWREMKVKQLIRLGVFAADPFKKETAAQGKGAGRGARRRAAAEQADQVEEGDEPLTGKAAVEAERKAKREREQRRVAEKSAEYKKRTIVLRGRIEPMIARLGGWNTGVGRFVNGITLSEFATTLMNWGERDEREEVPIDTLGRKPTAGAAMSATQMLRKPDETIGEKWLPLFEAFGDYLYGPTDRPDPGVAADRYRELVREWKGLGEIGPPPETDLAAGLREQGMLDEEPPPTEEAAEPEAEPTFDGVPLADAEEGIDLKIEPQDVDAADTRQETIYAKPGEKIRMPVHEGEREIEIEVVLAESDEPRQYVTSTGRVLNDADIEALAAEAERGYDVSRFVPLRAGTVSLAMEVLYAIMSSEQPGKDETLALIQRVVDLELNNPRRTEGE